MDAKSVSLGVSVVGTGVQAVALFYMWRSKSYRNYPALMAYLALQILFAVTFGVLPWGPHSISGVVRYQWYFWGYWTTYLLAAGLLLLTIQNLFREIMSPLPGLSRLGVLAFRWVVCISLIVALGTSYMPAQSSTYPLVSVASGLMRCVSVLELCLLAFITLIVHRLGLSYRSRPFGIALGFGMMACTDFLQSAFVFSQHTAFSSIGNGSYVILIMAVGVWAFYFAMPEPARSPLVLPVTSSLLRWNEISVALGHAGAQVTATPAHEFFLTDVEKVVDRVLIKNSLKATGI
jgi:hypothetical protein